MTFSNVLRHINKYKTVGKKNFRQKQLLDDK